jgi:hypothetical protein
MNVSEVNEEEEGERTNTAAIHASLFSHVHAMEQFYTA